jgi:hypothetical protein
MLPQRPESRSSTFIAGEPPLSEFVEYKKSLIVRWALSALVA